MKERQKERMSVCMCVFERERDLEMEENYIKWENRESEKSMQAKDSSGSWHRKRWTQVDRWRLLSPLVYVNN